MSSTFWYLSSSYNPPIIAIAAPRLAPSTCSRFSPQVFLSVSKAQLTSSLTARQERQNPSCTLQFLHLGQSTCLKVKSSTQFTASTVPRKTSMNLSKLLLQPVQAMMEANLFSLMVMPSSLSKLWQALQDQFMSQSLLQCVMIVYLWQLCDSDELQSSISANCTRANMINDLINIIIPYKRRTGIRLRGFLVLQEDCEVDRPQIILCLYNDFSNPMKKSQTAFAASKLKSVLQMQEERASFARKRCISDARQYKRLPKTQETHQRKKKALDRRLFFAREEEGIIQPECQESPNAEKLLSVKYFERNQAKEGSSEDPSLAKHNQAYLNKMKNTRRMRLNEGISLYSPERLSAVPEEFSVEEQRGLNRFTNIIIKRLENKCKKVSFSQFLEKKKEKEFQSKFRYLLPKRSSFGNGSSDDRNIRQVFGLGKFTDNLKANCHSSLLRDSKRFPRKSKSKEAERYHSLSHMDQLPSVSLQISKLLPKP